jgi:hypothetical protein
MALRCRFVDRVRSDMLYSLLLLNRKFVNFTGVKVYSDHKVWEIPRETWNLTYLQWPIDRIVK